MGAGTATFKPAEVKVHKNGTYWRTAWLDADGKKITATHDTQSKAYAHRRELLGQPKLPKSTRRKAAPKAVGAYDGTSQWWDRAHGLVAVAVLRAGQDGDAQTVDLWAKVARALSTLAGSQVSHRDLAEVERQLAEIEAHDAELETAGRDGTRINSAETDADGESSPRGAESIH